MAVVKANAYGVGAVGVAQALSSAGIDAFGVANVAEGVELRENGIAGTILCLSYFTKDEIDVIFKYDLTPTVFTLEAACLLSQRAQAAHRRQPVWVKVDTGLGRLGVPYPAAGDFIQQLAGQTGLEIKGLLSTLTENPERDPIQVQRLLDVRRQMPEPTKIQLSLASSHGILSRQASYLDVVRPGIMLLGLEPGERERMDMKLVQRANLLPVVTWKTRVGYVKTVPRGEQVGYGYRASLASDARVATLTVGWADGYSPAMSDTGHTLIHGRRCLVLGVSANSTMVDVSDLEVALGDEGVLLGKQASEEITAAEMARVTGASVYRLLVALAREVPRIWH